MKFGVFDHLDRNTLPVADFYQQRLEVVELYDRAGFYGYHLAEHHGTPLGMAPSPSVFLTAVARQTRRLRFGPMVYLLPLYHPIRLAEEIGMLDQLGRGRLDVGVGRGRSPIEVASYGCDPDQTEAIFDEAFDILRQGLTDGRVTYAGRYFNFQNVGLQTRPVQSPHPPFWYGIGSVGSIDRCVARGFNVVMISETPAAAEIGRRFRAAATAAGKDDLLVGLCRFVVVAEKTSDALAIARRAYGRWYASFNHLYAISGIRPVRSWHGTFDAMAEVGLAFAGSPEAVAEGLRAQLVQVGANYCVGQFVFGDMSFEESRRSIELFTNSVMPAIVAELSGLNEERNMDDVKVIASRYSDRPKTDPGARLFTIADHIVVDPEKLRSGRMYVGDEFRAVVLTLTPGQAQEVHLHPATSHAWFIVSGSGEVTLEDGRKDRVQAGMFCVHPRNSVHGVRNDGDENLTYVALSIGE